jgi:serine/threonine protein kinase
MDEERRCLVCGTPLPTAREFCPVCILRGALTDQGQGESGEKVVTGSSTTEYRFEHYELAKGEDGLPIELGRGAMGVTYKAFDVDLHRPVTLKVINEKYIGDEAARSRFMREARMAASLRHPHVASVFHLGKTGNGFFYAMEFVEGQTLESLIKRSDRLEPRRALEIAYQVADGLSAVHKQKLVHRDIKPSNIMVSFGDGDSVAVKIIDLGLAKTIQDETSEPSISAVGAFVGTPEFASPEQAAVVDVDIRSDLYSLGVTLWEMVTGHGLFRGPPADVIYQHQHAPLPHERLEDVPQPIIVLLEILLEKDPARRFQSPAELLNVIPSIMDSIDEGRTITYHSLAKISGGNADLFSRRRQGWHPPEKVSIARLPVTGSDMFGRDEDVDFLDRAWANGDVNVASNCRLDRCGQVNADQSLAPTDGCRALRFCRTGLRVVILQAGQRRRNFIRRRVYQYGLGLVRRSRSADRNCLAERGAIGRLDCASSNHADTGWLEPLQFPSVRKKDAFATLLSSRSCVSSLPSIVVCV